MSHVEFAIFQVGHGLITSLVFGPELYSSNQRELNQTCCIIFVLDHLYQTIFRLMSAGLGPIINPQIQNSRQGGVASYTKHICNPYCTFYNRYAFMLNVVIGITCIIILV